jgi:hypothetical protein
VHITRFVVVDNTKFEARAWMKAELGSEIVHLTPDHHGFPHHVWALAETTKRATGFHSSIGGASGQAITRALCVVVE